MLSPASKKFVCAVSAVSALKEVFVYGVFREERIFEVLCVIQYKKRPLELCVVSYNEIMV